MTLNHIWEAHRSLCEVASFVAKVLLRDSFPNVLPTPQYDQFKYMDRPLVETKNLQVLHELWRELAMKYDAFGQWTLGDYGREFC